MYACIHACRCPKRIEDGVRSHGTGVTDFHNLPYVGADR